MLGWLVDLLHHVISSLSSCLSKVHTVLSLFPPKQQRISKRRWYSLLGMLHSLVITIPGGTGLF